MLTNEIQRDEIGDIGTPGRSRVRETARSSVRRLLSAFAAIPAIARVSRAEMALLCFPEHLWDDSGTPRNGLERWIEPDPRDTAGGEAVLSQEPKPPLDIQREAGRHPC